MHIALAHKLPVPYMTFGQHYIGLDYLAYISWLEFSVHYVTSNFLMIIFPFLDKKKKKKKIS